MSLAELRAAEVTSRRDELSTLEKTHTASARELLAIYNIVQQNNNLAQLIHANLDPNSLTEDEAAFLQKHNLSRGPFDATVLTLHPPKPAPQRDDAPISTSKPTHSSSEPLDTTQQSAEPDVTVQDVPPIPKVDIAGPPDSIAAPAVQPPSPQLSVKGSKLPRSRVTSTRASAEPDGPTTAPVTVAPPLPEEEAQLSGSREQLLDQQVQEKPAKTVHLPPEEERRRQSDAESKSSRLQAPHTDLASSPSSTVGPYSAATPQPTQESPDTSPDSDTAQVEVLPPKDLQPTAEEQREKEEHDRILEAQKEIARKQALGDVAPTPDEQLKWEEKEAAARDAEERAAREAVGGPEPDTKDARDSTEAEQVAQEMEVEQEAQSAEAKAEEMDVDTTARSMPPPQTHAQDEQATSVTVEEPSAQEVEPKANSVTRASRPQPPPIDTVQRQSSRSETSRQSSPAVSRSDRMTTRVSSGALRQKSVSEILGHSQSPPAESSTTGRKELMSPESISPMTQRHPQDMRAPSAPSQPPRHQPRTAAPTRTPSMANPSLDQLESLRGAAEDPDRDYLEPLFRIQAHEAGNGSSRNKALPELIRMAPKALSTEDQFTSLHERLDFRMLRRIYQLQNANKWSLRQMERCKEPDQPVTHHDHMMAEMKWMRKDFKAERKMKKSICAWLAHRCAEWVAADGTERMQLQVKTKPRGQSKAARDEDAVPDLENSGDSAPEDDLAPTPRSDSPPPTTIVVAPELEHAVEELRKAGKLSKALVSLPKTGLLDREFRNGSKPVTLVSKFVEGKILPKPNGPSRKRSRYEYEDEAEAETADSERSNKRLREERQFPPDEPICALFYPENKPIRDRLHSNNAFRPPSEFLMPSTPFYEYRSGSQWIWDDDQRLRKLAKDYSFNWSLIADELTLPTRYKSSSERRTPWECFERWVELESLPTDMRKTMYFKTWFQRLEQSQQAAERRYQAQVNAIQQQAAQSGAQAHIPVRRRTVPTRVEKRRSARYLWMVDAFRKLAKKREQAAWKQAETARAAAQRKSQAEATQTKMVKMTPQEFSKKRQERDMQMAEAQRQHRAKLLENNQQRQLALARAQQQQQAGQNGAPGPRPPGAAPGQPGQVQPNGQPAPNGQASAAQQQQQQIRPGVPMAPQRNGHLAPPQVGAQGIPQAQMQARAAGMAGSPNMQPVGQAGGQGTGSQFAGQQYQMAGIASPGGTFSTQQQLQQNQALLQAFQQQQRQGGNGSQTPGMNQSGGQQMSTSPSMPPPPTPQNAPQQLSSGHVPQIIAIQNQLRAANPGISEEAVKAMATQHMVNVQSKSRQNAMNAAAGISAPNQTSMQQFNQSQGTYQRNANGQQMTNSMGGMYMNGDGNTQQNNTSPSANSSSPSQQMYAQKMWQRQQLQMQQMQQMSPNTSHAQLNGSPSLNHASPSLAPASPSMQYSNISSTMSNMNQMGQMGGAPMANMNGQQQRPPSRSATPQMQQQRLGSSGSGMGNGMQSPGALQGSPRNMQASMAR